MARGAARMLGITLMENFNLPYAAANTKEFWARWHISLSSWFGDYVYKPLGGSRSGKLKESRNIIITMLLSGLWHGAGLNFILWGFIHGVMHSLSKVLSGLSFSAKLPVWSKRIITFVLIVFTWIFFRAENAADAFAMIAGIFSFTWSMPAAPVVMVILMVLCYLFQWVMEYGAVQSDGNPGMKGAAAAAMALCVLALSSGAANEFIYLQF